MPSSELLRTKKFLTALNNIICINCGTNVKNIHKKVNSKVYELSYGRQDAIIICNWMYKNSPIFLHRKNEKFLEMCGAI